MERWRIIGYSIPATTAFLLAVALWMGNVALAFGVLAAAIAVSFLYAEWLKRRGEIISDERTLRIEEMASRRTLQVLVLALAFAVVVLSVLSEKDPNLRSAYYLALSLMVLTSALKLYLKHHYARVM
ncbi:hypothetical protein APY94_05735 [Thermococcus celericrescens]|uniref:DUF2178 domain-containing protein n=1 Tax=Thermococcus celericrescens TaxID=227598 RepID=A0A100XXZ9_9EURY|nr:DUF2178 domain-containing protein [Thermococcus celericrescens]KUH33466.1 hypothetical protein APY94_05735 [Thermococcus celericrescens]